MKVTVDGLEKERDFYFGKLREIETFCQEHENDEGLVAQDVFKSVLAILYATDVSFLIKPCSVSVSLC